MTTTIDNQDIQLIARTTAKVLHKYINKNRVITVEAISDIIQAGLEGYTEGVKSRLEQDKTTVV